MNKECVVLYSDGNCNLDEGVDGHDGHVGLALGVVHQVEVDQLLQLQVVRLHAVHHVREQRAAQRQDGRLSHVPTQCALVRDTLNGANTHRSPHKYILQIY